MAEVAQSYEMVRNFKAFVMFAVKNWKPCLAWSKNFEYAYVNLVRIKFFDHAYFRRENFFDLPTTFSGKVFTTWSKS